MTFTKKGNAGADRKTGSETARAFLAAVCFCLLASFPAAAEEATEKDAGEPEAPADASRDGFYTLPTITVTADKRATDIQKTPVAITVMTEEKLEDANIDTVQKVLARVPNLHTSTRQDGSTMMSFRGALTSQGTYTSPIILYLDGVPVDTYFNLDAALMDVERVEVLRGPQSAIYGKNAKGGGINIFTHKPDNTWRNKFTAEYGNDNTQKLGATVSGPLVEDRLFFSLSGMHDSTDGYMDHPDTNDGNERRTERVKGVLRFTPTSKTEFNLYADYSARRDGYTNLIIGNHPTFDSAAGKDDYTDSDIANIALTAKIDTDAATLESITTYRYETLDFIGDATKMFEPIWPMPIRDYMAGRDNTRTEFTQEFRIKSPDDAPGVAWLAGVYGGYTDMDISKVFSDTDYPDMMGPGVDAHYDLNQPSREYTKDLAAFGQISVPLTEKWKATTALRLQRTEKNIHLAYDETTSVPSLGMDLPVYRSGSGGDVWTEWMPKFNLAYTLSDTAMVYAGVNRSFIPGGFNNVATDFNTMKYEPETAWNYEVGAKTNWFDNRLSANLALFYSDFKDLQIFRYDAVSASYLSSNAGSARSYGVELDMVARLLPGLDAEASFGYTHAKFEDYDNGTANHAHKWIPLTPRYTGNFALQYRHENGLFLRGEAIWYGKLYWDEGNAAERGSITLLNAKIGYEMGDMGFYLYGNNLTDKKYLDFYTLQSNAGYMAAPLEFGAQVQYRF